MSSFFPAEGEKAPFFEVGEGQAPLELPEGVSNEPEEDADADAAVEEPSADENSGSGDGAEGAPESAPDGSDSPPPDGA